MANKRFHSLETGIVAIILNPKTGKTVGIIYSVSETTIGQKRYNSPGMSRVMIPIQQCIYCKGGSSSVSETMIQPKS